MNPLPLPLRLVGQAAIFAGFAALIWTFSQSPDYQPIPEGQAQVKFSFAHGGKAKGGCRDRSAEELAKLPPNMRKTKVCPRERVPVAVEFRLDGDLVYQESLPPTGARKDGASRTYQKFLVAAGTHRLDFRLRDSERSEGFDYVADRTVTLVAGQNLAVDFDAEAGGFLFR